MQDLMGVERLIELLKLPIEIKDPVEPVKVSDVKGEISLQSLSFDYNLLPPLRVEAVARRFKPTPKTSIQKRADWALRDVSVTFKAGTKNAIVGKSGAGKSTLLKLIHRLLDPTQGLIKLDGVDIRQIKLEELIGFMGIVAQDSFFFNDTVKNNLLFAKPDATDEEIEQACRAANVWTLIDSFANKLDEKIGEHGYKLSGGERQREFK